MCELTFDVAFSFPQRRGSYWCVWQYPENKVVVTALTRKAALTVRNDKARVMAKSGHIIAFEDAKGVWARADHHALSCAQPATVR